MRNGVGRRRSVLPVFGVADRCFARNCAGYSTGVNLRGVFRFPVERYAADLMPSLAAPIIAAVG